MLLMLIGRGAQFVLLLLMMRVATSLLSPSEVGGMALIVSITAIFSFSLINPVGMYINRKLHEWEENGETSKRLTYYWWYLVIISVFSTLVIILADTFNLTDIRMGIIWVIILVSGSILFNTVNQTVVPSLNLLGYPKHFIVYTILTIVCSIILGTILVLMFGREAEYWLLGVLAGQAIIAAIASYTFYGRLQNSANSFIEIGNLSGIFKFSWPVAIAVGLTWFQIHGYRFFIENTYGVTQLGLFFAGYWISAGLIIGLESVFSAYFHPKFYKLVNKNTKEAYSYAWNEYFSAVVPSLVVTAGLVVALAPELTELLLGKEFQGASKYIFWGALVESMRAVASLYGMVSHANMNTKLLIIPNAIGAASLIIALWLMPVTKGVAGIGISLVVSWVIVIIFMHKIMAKQILIKINYSHIFMCLPVGIILVYEAEVIRNVLTEYEKTITYGVLLSVLGVTFIITQALLLKSYIGYKGNNN